MKYSLCQIDEIGLSCIGCCGIDIYDGSLLLKGIIENTQNYKTNLKEASLKDKINYIQRAQDHVDYDLVLS